MKACVRMSTKHTAQMSSEDFKFTSKHIKKCVLNKDIYIHIIFKIFRGQQSWEILYVRKLYCCDVTKKRCCIDIVRIW